MKVFVRFPGPSVRGLQGPHRLEEKVQALQGLQKLREKIQVTPALQHLNEKIRYGRHCLFFKGLILKGPISREERDRLLGLLASSVSEGRARTIVREAIEELYQKALSRECRAIARELERLEKEITKYGEIFIEFPDVWHERRLIEYGKTRKQDISDIRDLCKEGIQATFKEASLTGVGVSLGEGSSAKIEPATPQSPARPGEGLALPLQDQFRLKSTFLAEVELQKLVEGRDDDTLLRGYSIYLLRFLVSVLPGKRYPWHRFNKEFDSRNVYAEVTMRMDAPQPKDLEKAGLTGVVEEFIKDKGFKTVEEWLEDIEKRRKPYVYSFIPQEYVQHIGAWSAIGRKYGFDVSFPQSQASPATTAEAKEEKKGEKVFEAKSLGKKIPLEKLSSLLKTFSGIPEIPTISPSVRRQYNAESEAILSHQTLISFMRDDSEVGWLFGPRLVGPHRRVPEKGVKQVYVLLAAPGELPLVRLSMTTNWVNIDDLGKRAYTLNEACKLLEEYKCIRKRINFLGEKEDTVVRVLLAQAERLYSRMPSGSGLLFLPYDSDKIARKDECGIGNLKPVIDSIIPNSGPCNVETTVLIRGRNFDYDAQVKIDGEDAPSVTLINRETLIATIPPSKLGRWSADVRVLTPVGISDITQSTTFTYTSEVQTPKITEVKPKGEIPPTGQPITVTISGSNFDRNTKVLANEKEVSADYVNEKTLMARFPEDLRGKRVAVKVYNPKGVDRYDFWCPKESLFRKVTRLLLRR